MIISNGSKVMLFLIIWVWGCFMLSGISEISTSPHENKRVDYPAPHFIVAKWDFSHVKDKGISNFYAPPIIIITDTNNKVKMEVGND